jgi:DNA-binding NtrC family response regulator
VAPQETTLLLTGQTGTGKTRLARLIHELSPRRHDPFLVVDCGALSPTLIESELFGHAKGAFTGAERDRAGKLAAAGRGTLLLDEVNSLPLPLQAKLLRAVDEHVFEPVGANRSQPLHARLIAASNAELQREVEAGRFRSDLYYRLNVVAFFLPPLRERRSSVAPLAHRFLAEFATRNRADVTGLSSEALRALEAYDWPGNVRELRNVLERAVALCPGPRIEPTDLPEVMREEGFALPSATTAFLRDSRDLKPASLQQSKQEVEVRRILEALHKNGNNRLRAAQELGISRVALYKKLHKYGLMETRSWAANGVSTALSG